jgi:hypothetical protein
MMTVAAIMAGLLPIMWSHGTGAEVMQRIAVPMVGGMVSSTLLTLIVIPAIYAVVKGIAIRLPRLTPSADDSHNFGDAVGLILAWAAQSLAQREPTATPTASAPRPYWQRCLIT